MSSYIIPREDAFFPHILPNDASMPAPSDSLCIFRVMDANFELQSPFYAMASVMNHICGGRGHLGMRNAEWLRRPPLRTSILVNGVESLLTSYETLCPLTVPLGSAPHRITELIQTTTVHLPPLFHMPVFMFVYFGFTCVCGLKKITVLTAMWLFKFCSIRSRFLFVWWTDFDFN